VQLYKAANERPAPFIDHTGVLRDSKTGRPINGYMSDEEEDDSMGIRESYLFIYDNGEHI
jgi:carnitine O-acetyltransferase